MKWIHTCYEYYVCVDDEDYEEVSQYLWRSHRGAYARCHHHEIKDISLHHLLKGKPLPGKEVDHINRAGWDNRKSNLRIVDKSVNLLNRGLPDNPPFPTEKQKEEAKKQRLKIKKVSTRRRDAQKGKDYSYLEKPVKDDLGNVYKSAAAVAKKYGAINGSNVTECCKGKKRSLYGRKWSYA